MNVGALAGGKEEVPQSFAKEFNRVWTEESQLIFTKFLIDPIRRLPLRAHFGNS